MGRQFIDRKIKYLLLVLFGLLLNNGYSQQGFGTNIRGQIQTFNSYYNTYFVLPNAVVDLYYNPPNTSNFIFKSQTITNRDGFYFFYKVEPLNYYTNCGNYYLQVNRSKNYLIYVNVLIYTNYIYNFNQFQDIPILYY